MLINISQIPCLQWDPLQRDAAFREYGLVVDYRFPEVSASATKEDISTIAHEVVKDILQRNQEAVYLVKGELSLTIAIIDILRKKGCVCVTPASERWVEEIQHGKHSQKRTRHRFVQFREV